MSEKFMQHNSECSSEDHDKHLCYFVSQGFHLSNKDAFDALTDNAKYICQHCGRKANSDQNLCEPMPINS